METITEISLANFLQLEFLKLFRLCVDLGLVKRKRKMPIDYENIETEGQTPSRRLFRLILKYVFPDCEIKGNRTSYIITPHSTRYYSTWVYIETEDTNITNANIVRLGFENIIISRGRIDVGFCNRLNLENYPTCDLFRTAQNCLKYKEAYDEIKPLIEEASKKIEKDKPKIETEQELFNRIVQQMRIQQNAG